ncbi:MAG TPA: hypothetical protein DCS29_04705 [Candidatus Magasanikbacteria bacterium]|nr:hypothetical protein [Candidatus Magasanikbacteria bacterium]
MKILFRKKTKQPQISDDLGNLSHIRLLNIVSIFIIIGSIASTCWFVYTNIYRTIGKVQILILAEKNPRFEPINFKLYNDTLTAWDEKYNAQNIIITRDPFNQIPIATTTSTTSTLNEAND